jgi:protein TonB
MAQRTRAHGTRGGHWRRPLALSVVLHGLALLAIAAGAWTTATGGGDVRSFWPAAIPLVETPTLVDLTAIDTLPSLDVVVPPPTAEPPIVSGPPADQSSVVPHQTVAAPGGGADERRAPAADRGAGQGVAVEDPALRRDATTLHERLSDGAERYQPSHVRTATRATSPEAVRREMRTGVGDSAITRRVQRTPFAASYGVVDAEARGAGAPTTEGTAVAPDLRKNEAAPESDRTTPASSQGPLDAETGARSFDVESLRVAVADDRTLRAASQEDHPAITDLTRAAVSGHATEGRGPSDTPGAVPHASPGAAAARAGVRGAFGASGSESATQERRYDRYKQEIGKRIERALVYPRTLAVRLEQGETILHFVVRPDGGVDDAIRVVKSSGFVEFDQAALDAVRKASPFRPMPDAGRARPLGVTLPVNFPNPVIR